MILALAALAHADPVVVVLREDDRAFNGAFPRGTLTDAAGTSAPVDPQDGGAAPDVVRGDGVYAGVAEGLGAGPYTLRVTDGGDMRVWTGTVSPVGEPPALLVALGPDRAFTALEAGAVPVGAPTAGGAGGGTAPAGDAPPGPASPQPQPAPTSAAPASGGAGPAGDAPSASSTTTVAVSAPFSAVAAARAAGWLLLVVAAGWVLAGSRRFSLAALEAVPGEAPPLRPGLHRQEGDWRAAVRRLAGPARVLLVGAHDPGAVPAGTVFALGAGPIEVDEVVALTTALAPAGPPMVVVVVGATLVGGAGDAAAELSARLPRTEVRHFPG